VRVGKCNIAYLVSLKYKGATITAATTVCSVGVLVDLHLAIVNRKRQE